MTEMTLTQRIDDDLKQAMRAKDDVAKLTLRAVKTALTEASKSGTESHPMDDDDVLAVVMKEAKRRRDAMAEYEKAGRPDLAASEAAELVVLEHYLPRQLSEAEIQLMAQGVIQAVGATSMRDMGKVMSALMEEVAGQADGRAVNQVVRKLLA